jgi:hypothetical protein
MSIQVTPLTAIFEETEKLENPLEELEQWPDDVESFKRGLQNLNVEDPVPRAKSSSFLWRLRTGKLTRFGHESSD